MTTAMTNNSCSFEGDNRISAVIFDLDGTLLDTESAGEGILKEFLARFGKELNEEIKKKRRRGLTQKESAVYIVKDYDLPLTPDRFIKEITPMNRERWKHTKALPGASRLIKHLHKHQVPLALASNSLREYVETKISYQQDWKKCFSVITGSDEVKSGKPSPDIFLEAARRMGVDAASCLVIEDSLVGVTAAKAANMRVVAAPSRKELDCIQLADRVIHSLLDFKPELWGLPPFEDWVDNALPIEPVHFTSRYKDGSVNGFTDYEISHLPDQVLGVYFGWAEEKSQGLFKAVVSIGWDGYTSSTRKIKICIIDGNYKLKSDQQWNFQLLGYIRGFSTSKRCADMEMNIVEEDKSIANAALGLSNFSPTC